VAIERMVCMDKFFGKARGQQVAAMMERDRERSGESGVKALRVEKVKGAGRRDERSYSGQLLEQQKALANQIAAWEAGFFKGTHARAAALSSGEVPFRNQIRIRP